MSNDSCRGTTGKQAGFTLLEVLVGLMISAAVMVGFTTLAQSVQMGWGRVVEKLSGQETMDNGLAIAAGDVSRMQRVVNWGLSGPAYSFAGDPGAMTFVIAERPASSARGLYWIRLYSRKTPAGTALVRARAPFEVKPGPVGDVNWSDEVVLTEGNFSFGFGYGGKDNLPGTWLGAWPAGDSLPDRVQVRVENLETGDLVYPPLVIALKLGAEAACVDIESQHCTMRSAGKLVNGLN